MIAPTSRVLEVDSARAWVELVDAYPLEKDRGWVPDWLTVSAHYDLVHLTLPAVVAMQGIPFEGIRGTYASTYWDVETTLWLRAPSNDGVVLDTLPAHVSKEEVMSRWGR